MLEAAVLAEASSRIAQAGGSRKSDNLESDKRLGRCSKYKKDKNKNSTYLGDI